MPTEYSRYAWPQAIFELLERQLDEIFAAAKVHYQKTRDEYLPSVLYEVRAKPDIDLELSFSLSPDTLTVAFNDDGYFNVELSGASPKFGANPNAESEWSAECVRVVRNILGSDLKCVTRTRRGRGLGGYLYCRQANQWICCGGGANYLTSFLGRRREREYWNWQA